MYSCRVPQEKKLRVSDASVCVSGASGRPGGADRRRVRPADAVPAGGGGARQGEAAEAEGGEAEAAGGGAHPDHRADQPAGEHGRAASPQAEGGGEPGAAEGEGAGPGEGRTQRARREASGDLCLLTHVLFSVAGNQRFHRGVSAFALHPTCAFKQRSIVRSLIKCVEQCSDFPF